MNKKLYLNWFGTNLLNDDIVRRRDASYREISASDYSLSGALFLRADRTLMFFNWAIGLLVATLWASILQPSVAVADDLPKKKALAVLPLAPVENVGDPSLTPALPTDGAVAGEFAGNASSDVVAAQLSFSTDNRFLLIGDTSPKKDEKHDNSLNQLFARLWDLQRGKELRRFAAGKHDRFSSLQMSATQKLVAGIAGSSSRPVTGRSSSLLLWDAETGEEYMHLQFGRRAGEEFKPEFVAFSPDSKQLFAVDGNGYSLRSWDVGRIVSEGQTDHQWSCDGVLHSQPLGARTRRSLFVSGYHRTPYVFDGDTFYSTVGDVLEVSSDSGRIINRFSTEFKDRGRCLALSSDDALLATGNGYRDLEIRDARTGKVLRVIKCEVGVDSAVACFMKSDRRLLATLDDGKTREWDLETGKETFNFVAGRPCAISSDGTLVAGYRQVEKSSKGSAGRVEITHVPTRRRLMALYPSHEAREYTSEVSSLAQAAGKSAQGDVEAFMASYLDGKAENSQSQITRPSSELKDERGRLFLLSVGVSKHKFPEYNLGYAAADAEALVDFFRTSESDLYREVYVASITDEEASAERIIQAIEWTKEACSEKDVCIIAFSGHGIKGKKGLYFVCHEGDANGMQYTCLNWSKVGEAIAAINAKQTLILADCCHAGAFAVEHSGPQSKLIEAFADRKNVFIFSSSHADQLSLELPQKKHGAFTAAILDSLRGAADSDNNGIITLGELQQQVIMDVRRMTSGKQLPTVPFPDRYDPNTELVKVR